VVPAAAQSRIVAISAGITNSMALTADGRVIAWSDRQYGEADVPADAQSGVTAIAQGAGFGLALKNGGVIAWGYDASFQTEVPPEAQSGVLAVGLRAQATASSA
jgi:alpha-tubulin suppressor-like RCC1 family protein